MQHLICSSWTQQASGCWTTIWRKEPLDFLGRKKHLNLSQPTQPTQPKSTPTQSTNQPIQTNQPSNQPQPTNQPTKQTFAFSERFPASPAQSSLRCFHLYSLPSLHWSDYVVVTSNPRGERITVPGRTDGSTDVWRGELGTITPGPLISHGWSLAIFGRVTRSLGKKQRSPWFIWSLTNWWGFRSSKWMGWTLGMTKR